MQFNSCQKGRGGDKSIHLSCPGTKRAKHDIKSINVCPESGGRGPGVNTFGPRIFLIIQPTERRERGRGGGWGGFLFSCKSEKQASGMCGVTRTKPMEQGGVLCT